MRVLALVTDAFGGHGGIALYVRNVLTALCNHPAVSEVVAIPRVIPNPIEPLPANLTYLTGAKGSRLRFAAATAMELLRRNEFDLIVCGHVHLLSLAEIGKRITGAPIVLFVYGIEAWRPSHHPLSNFLAPRVDSVVSIRELTLERMNDWAHFNGMPTHLLENAIHLDHYGPAPRNQALVEKYGLAGKRVIMTLGRVEETRKGFEEVIEVLPELTSEFPNLIHLVVGGGYDLPRIKQKAVQAGVADRVVFTDLIDDAAKPDHYRLADAFAMPGSAPDFDRYPVRFVFLEAMACGLPVVASRPEGSRDLGRTQGLPLYFVDPTSRESIKAGIRSAFQRGPGVVPAALSAFAYPSFEDRLRRIVDGVVQKRPARNGVRRTGIVR
jgi:glycosyltransferase involved in cell wall biosynthesis